MHPSAQTYSPHARTLRACFWWVITGRATLIVREANQLESVCAVKGHLRDKPGHRVACLLCHPSTRGAVITDKCHSLEVIDGNGIQFWPAVLHALIIPMAS